MLLSDVESADNDEHQHNDDWYRNDNQFHDHDEYHDGTVSVYLPDVLRRD